MKYGVKQAFIVLDRNGDVIDYRDTLEEATALAEDIEQDDENEKMKNECKVLIGHDFNYSHKDIATVNVVLVTTDGTKVIETIQGENSTGCLDLTSVLQDNGYKVVCQN